ncbi:hypothetical protein TWF718_010213 [Orbilia javanica]|uniref:Uncharacterized protein n=1 Tax=Orbilia javanica TaxID=47235 RepID=A0AAN8RDT2_9PEZI
MTDDHTSYPLLEDRLRPPLPPGSSRRRTFAQTMKRQCESCECDDTDGGTIVPVRVRVRGRESSRRCPTERMAMRCRYWYECRCVIIMKANPKDPAISIKEYQDALNNLPFAVKRLNPDYSWTYGEQADEFLKWQYSGSYPPDSSYDFEASPDLANGRQLVPGTKEPYYLEGPDFQGPIHPKPLDDMLGYPIPFPASGSWKRKSKRSFVDDREDTEVDNKQGI